MSAPDRDDLLAAYRAERGPTRAQAQRLWARVSADVDPRANVRRMRSAAPGRGRAIAIAAVVLAAAAAVVLALQPSARRVEGRAPNEPSLAAHGADGDRETATGEASSVAPRRQSAAPADDAPTRSDAGTDPGAADLDPVDESAVRQPASTPSQSPTSTRSPGRPRSGSASGSGSGSHDVASRPARPPTDSLAAETALLRRARAALSEGRPSAAIEMLRDYDARFPSARLSEEADAVRTMARCRQAPGDPGALADAFVSRHPGSLFRKQVAASCASADQADAG